MEDNKQPEEQSAAEEEIKTSILGDCFNLHPLDAQSYIVRIDRSLQDFTYAFKDRIEVQIEYAKGLLRVSKQLEKYIDPESNSPLSYISSAFKVAHQQRARHALQLSQYLHTEIQVICQKLLQEHFEQARNIDSILQAYYREGEAVEENYQKALKKYHRIKVEWEERMISNSITQFNPAISQQQRIKAAAKLTEERKQIESQRQKYLVALNQFNKFAEQYNENISSVLQNLERRGIAGVAAQSTSLRKLIVSEINMFKNIEYDLLNICKQMQVVQPADQIVRLKKQYQNKINMPILHIYAQGPVEPNQYQINSKVPISSTFLETTFQRIQKGILLWMQSNRSDSTLTYCVTKACRRAEGTKEEEGQTDFLQQFQESVMSNKVVLMIPKDIEDNTLLNPTEAATLSYQVVIWVTCFLRKEGISEQTRSEMRIKLQHYLSLHHFYRFLAMMALEESRILVDNHIQGSPKNFVNILLDIISESYKAKDVFILREALSLMFTTTYNRGDKQVPLYCCLPLAQLEVWEDLDFWQSASFEASFEEISMLPINDRAELREVFLMRQKNTVFSGLATYCHYMAMMGMEEPSIRSVVAKLSQSYHLMQQHQRDLVKTIASSVKQYHANSD